MNRSITAVLLGTFSLRFSTGLTGGLLVFYLDALPQFGGQHVASTTVGLLTAGYYAAELVLSPMFGYLSDRFGAHRIMQIGPIFGVAAALITAFAVDLWILGGTRILEGGAAAASIPSILGYLALATSGDQALRTDRPIIFVANHTNWWDGFLACIVGRALGTTFYVLMESRHLTRYRFFLRVGALPLDRASAPRAYADLDRARGVLGPGAGLWVFPQGARRPAAMRPSELEAGAAHLALTAPGPVQICPVAFRYGYLGEHLPEAFVWVGEPWGVAPGSGERRALTNEIGGRISSALDRLDDARDGERLEEFELVVRGSLSLNKRLDRLRHRLGWLDGPFEERNG